MRNFCPLFSSRPDVYRATLSCKHTRDAPPWNPQKLMDDVAAELEVLARERAWFARHAEQVMASVAKQLAASVAPWTRHAAAFPGNAARPLSPVAGGDESVAGVSPAVAAVPKSTALSLDDILKQARAPKSAGGGGTTQQRAAKKEKEKEREKHQQSEEDKMISFRSADQTFSGFVVIQGYNCVDAELKVLFAANHRGTSGSAELEIRASRPWRLAQLQNAGFLVGRACEHLEKKELAAALEQLRAAQDELMRPSARVFPADPRVFHPRLPGELFVEFLIVDHMLQANAVLVRPASGVKFQPPIPLSLAEVRAGDVMGSAPGKAVEVLEATRVVCPLPAVAVVAEALQRAVGQLLDVQNNSVALQ
jgi:hypothetical protein